MRTFLTVLIIVFLNACDTMPHKVDRAAEIVAVEEVLESYIIANENQDFDLIQKIWAPNADIILYGTNTDERLMGWTNIRNAIRAQFNLIENTYISASDQYIQISGDGKTAWFAETLNYNFVYNGEARTYNGLRFTGVLQKIDDHWLFVQAHLSVPASIKLSD
ncbi:MAG: nuclear transport factor 2 family protein [bacterium]